MICYVLLLQSQAEVHVQHLKFIHVQHLKFIHVQHLKFIHVITNILVKKTPIALKYLNHIPCILL